MSEMKIYDSLSNRSPEARALVDKLKAALSGLADGVDFKAEDSIPTLELWVSGAAVMTPKRVLSFVQAIAGVTDAPLHFHEMRATSCSLFLYDYALLYPGDGFSVRQREEYGVAIEQWRAAILADA